MLYMVRVCQEVRVLGGGGRVAARAQARADRARLPPPQRVHHARPPVHLAGRLAPRPRGLLPRPHRPPRLPRRRQAREVNRACVAFRLDRTALRCVQTGGVAGI